MVGYKLFRKRRDGSLGPLFINRKQRLEPGVEYNSENHPTKGFAIRPGWHICLMPYAPHLTLKGRVWCQVEFHDFTIMKRPWNQGGNWCIANKMKILEVGPSM